MKKLVCVALVVCLISAAIPMVMAAAQGAPSAEELIENMAVSFEAEEPVLTRIQRVVTGPRQQEEQAWEVWSRDRNTFRAQRHDNTLLIWTEEQIGIYVPPPSNVAFVIPRETIDGAGGDVPQWLKAAGIELPGADLAPLREIDIEDAWSLSDEDARTEIDWPASDKEEFGEECWVLTLSPPALALLNETANDDTFTTDAAHIAIGKDTGYWRGVYLAMSSRGRDNRPMSVDVRLPTIATDTHSEEGDFVWRAPEGAKVVNWAPGNVTKKIGRLRTALNRTVRRPLRPTPPMGLFGDREIVYSREIAARPADGEAIGDQDSLHSAEGPSGTTLRIVEPGDGARVEGRFTVRVMGPPLAEFRWAALHSRGGARLGPAREGMARIGPDGKASGVFDVGHADTVRLTCDLYGRGGEIIQRAQITVYSGKRPPEPALRITEPRDGARVDGRFTVRVEGPPDADFHWAALHSRDGAPLGPAREGVARIGPDGRSSGAFDIGDADTLRLTFYLPGAGGKIIQHDQITVHSGKPPPAPTLRIVEPRDGARVKGQFTVRVEGPPGEALAWTARFSSRSGLPSVQRDRGRIGPDGEWSAVLDIGDFDTLKFSCAVRVGGGSTVSEEITVRREGP